MSLLYTVIHIMSLNSPRLLSIRSQFLLVVLLFNAILISSHHHVTGAESYPLGVHRRKEVEEKLPDTNGMFFGKRSSTAAVSTISQHDLPLLAVSHRRHKVRPFYRRHGVGKTQLGQQPDHARRFVLKNVWDRTVGEPQWRLECLGFVDVLWLTA